MRCVTSHFDQVIMVVGTTELVKLEEWFRSSAKYVIEAAIDCCADNQSVIISAI